MKYIIATICALMCSALFAHAQTATLPKIPDMPKAPSDMPQSPCDTEMKAAMKNLPKIEPGKDPKFMPKPDVNSKEAKALQDCLKKNAPKGATAAPLKPANGSAEMKAIDPTKLKAPPAGAPAAPVANGAVQTVKKGPQTTTTAQCPNLTKLLKVGSKDAEVITLKKFLTSEKVLQGTQNTDYFGPATEKALKEWQKKKGIVQSGTTDVATRAAIKNCAVQKATPAKTGTKK